MNRKGQNLILALITALMLFAAGMLFLNHVKDHVSITKSIDMDCSNAANSDGTKVTCLGIDLVVPILFILVVSIAGGTIASRFLI